MEQQLPMMTDRSRTGNRSSIDEPLETRGQVRILYMEDDAVLARLFERHLTRAGYIVDVAVDGRQGLEKMATNAYHVLVVDQQMPEKSGLEVIRSLATQGKLPPTIMVTGAGSEAVAVEAMKLGISDYMIKDAELRYLALLPSAIERALQNHFLVEENRRAADALRRAHDELETRVQERTKELVAANLRLRAEIAERKKAEERIQRQHHFLQSVMESLTHPFYVIDVDNYEVLLANSAARATAIQAGSTCFALTHCQDRPCNVSGNPCPLDELKRTCRPTTVEQVHRYPNGSSRVVEVHAYPIFDRTGQVVQAIEYCIDITDRKDAENATRQSEEMMRLLIESSPIGIMIVNQGRYEYVNEALVKMFGYESWHEITGRPIESLYAPESRDLFAGNHFANGNNGARGHSSEVKAIRRDGQPFSASLWMRSIEFRGEPALLCFLVDVSEEKALRAQLLLAQKMEALGTLAGGIAHDFNNILFAIMGYTELSMELVPRGTKLHEDLQAILKAATRARDLVAQILTFSRHKGEISMSPLRIELIVKETVKFLRATIPSTIEIRHRSVGEPGSIMGSPTQIHQVLMNLCTNAAHAMREKGGVLGVAVDHVTVKGENQRRYPDLTPGRYLRVSVSDTGHGMDQEVLRRIFEPFYTTKEPGEGTGLGLAVVHGIVKNHGGTVVAHSEQGKGSRFEVLLPRVEDQPEDDTAIHSRPATGNERILFVDDDRSLTDMTRKILRSLGYNVTTRNSSVEALELFRSKPNEFDMVITDMTMPNMTGKDLAAQFMLVRPDIPVILCTGYSDLITEEQAREIGIANLMIKPLLKRQLAETIRTVLDRYPKRDDSTGKVPDPSGHSGPLSSFTVI